MTTISVLEYPDIELWLSGWLRDHLADWSPRVDRRFPRSDETVNWWVVVRDDSGPDAQFSATRTVAVTCIGPEGEHAATQAFAQRVAALIRAAAIPGASTPVAFVQSVRGPYAVDGDPLPHFYTTADLTVVGTPLTLTL